VYSVQQLLFDCTSYLKEFEQKDRLWYIGAVSQGSPVAGGYDAWVCRPALSRRAALTVVERLHRRHHLCRLAPVELAGRYVFLGRRIPRS
jgi:hypothetical protein